MSPGNFFNLIEKIFPFSLPCSTCSPSILAFCSVMGIWKCTLCSFYRPVTLHKLGAACIYWGFLWATLPSFPSLEAPHSHLHCLLYARCSAYVFSPCLPPNQSSPFCTPSQGNCVFLFSLSYSCHSPKVPYFCLPYQSFCSRVFLSARGSVWYRVPLSWYQGFCVDPKSSLPHAKISFLPTTLTWFLCTTHSSTSSIHFILSRIKVI